MKKKGSTLVETIVSLAILLLGLALISNLILSLKNSHSYRKLREEASRITYAIESEIKYNYKKEELQSIFLDVEAIELNFEEDFLEELLAIDLFDFPRGHGIVIGISNSSDDNIKEFTILIKDIKGVILSERKFYKNNWMDL
jgi:hypothetical protein